MSNISKQQEKKIKLKIIKILKMWEDADIQSFRTKKMIADHIFDDIKNLFNPPPRGL